MRSAVILGALAVLLRGRPAQRRPTSAGAAARAHRRVPDGAEATPPGHRRARLRERPHRDLRPRPGRPRRAAAHARLPLGHRRRASPVGAGLPRDSGLRPGPRERGRAGSPDQRRRRGAARPACPVDRAAPPGTEGRARRADDLRRSIAWRVLVRAEPTHVYDTVVDATTGERLLPGRPRAEATARLRQLSGSAHWRRPGRQGLLGDRRRPRG